MRDSTPNTYPAVSAEESTCASHGHAISFSVVIPLFNKGDAILQAVVSVLEQTYQSFEVIVVNDGSTDGADRLVEGVADARVRLIHQANQGVSAARNRGIAEAAYPYVAFLDADDTWDPTLLEECVELIERFPGCGIYGVNHRYALPDGAVIGEAFHGLFGAEKAGIIQDYFGVCCVYHRSPFSNSGFCAPRDLLRGLGGYKVGVRLTEDSDLWCRIAVHHRIAFTTKFLCTYNIQTQNSSMKLFEPNSYEVVRTLQGALLRQEIPKWHLASARKLIAHFELDLVKRAVLQSRTRFALSRVATTGILRRYPAQALGVLALAFLPTRLIRYLARVRAVLRSDL